MSSPVSHPDLVLVRIARAWDETPALRGLTVDAPELMAHHRVPGQYVRAEVAPGIDGYFALANAPGRPLEILVKRGGSAADAMTALAAGDTLPLGVPTGPGFPLAVHGGRDLLLFAAGTGIAPIRAVVQHVIADRARFGAVRVYHGQRHAEEFAYAGEHAAWRAAGVTVIPVLSGGDPAWRGVRGHVQDALRHDPPPLARAAAYVCGMSIMETEVAGALAGLGLAPAEVYRNH